MMVKSFFIFAGIFLSAFPLVAQTHIDKVVEQIKGSDCVENMIYSEERDPKTKKLVMTRYFITYSNPKYNQLIYDAMKKDRADATGYSEVVNTGCSAVYKIEFVNGSKKAAYTMLLPGNNISVEVFY